MFIDAVAPASGVKILISINLTAALQKPEKQEIEVYTSITSAYRIRATNFGSAVSVSGDSENNED